MWGKVHISVGIFPRRSHLIQMSVIRKVDADLNLLKADQFSFKAFRV